ncbi:MotA/TolQ/ExbB proton channel family protein [Chitinivorax sp. B]|uniref:MotA/TolQ/ExbB proton channel family protein n=1 Tax=Chitinivorax sp. B TaxID=2502235 RepID=UPI0010F45964|nr:MotA/TolQ/ExbB proton channel family protein [Chitinivorax sp. B]
MLDFIIEVSVLSGGLVPVLALVLLISLAVIIERWWYIAKVVKIGDAIEHDILLVKYQSVEQLQQVAKHYEGSPQANVVKAAVASRGESAEDMERHIEEALLWELPKLDKNLWVLDTGVTLGPLLGLFGTVIGMIQAFGAIGNHGVSNPNAITGGIGHALIATAGGLLIAIFAVGFLNYFNKRIRLTVNQLELVKTMLINRLHGGGVDHAVLQGKKAAASNVASGTNVAAQGA